MELSSLFLAGKGSALTSFFSTAFLVVFLPFCLVVYSLMPRRGKKYFLLAADCAFFWLISGKLLVYLLLTALSMHYFGLWLDKIQSETKLLLAQTEKAERKTVRKRQQAVQHRIVLLAVILHIGVLFALKYSGFAATNVNTLLAHLHIPVQLAIPKYVMPIGISFFTLQALSYIVDVQRGVTKADTNLLRLTLFISFFPQIVEGPICRYDQTAQQLWDAKPITYENLTLGLQRIAYGMMKKIIIADRLNPLVRNVFNNYTDFDGGVIALAAVCYTVQLYMDFSGCCDIALGAARILGYDLIENFQSPFEARTFNDFWRRWHISMTSWFRDYVYFSLGGSRCAPWRHYLNIVIVFVCSGLWHGADWRYLAWGLFTGLLAAFGVMTARARQRINRYNPLYRMGWFKVFWQCLFTNALFCLTLVFFASAIYNTDPFAVYGSLLQGWDGLTGSWAQVSNLIYSSGIDGRLPVVLLFGCFVVFAAEHKGRSVARWIRQQVWPLRWTLYYGMAAAILFFAAFGQSAFIYQQY
mgnify:FL=1